LFGLFDDGARDGEDNSRRRRCEVAAQSSREGASQERRERRPAASAAAPAKKAAAVKKAQASRPKRNGRSEARRDAGRKGRQDSEGGAKSPARPIAALQSLRQSPRGPSAADRSRPVAPARPHLVRDSFTMPEQEYAVLGAVKQACLKAGFEVKKSELLRIGVALLGQLDAPRCARCSTPASAENRPPAWAE
jgi:hypothetical protein